VQLATQYGIKMHEQKCEEYGVKETRVCNKKFPGISDRERPDLVVIDDGYLKVYEFKPENSKAKADGEKALNDYVPAVAAYYQSFFPNGRAGGIDKNKSQDGERRTKEIAEALEKSAKAWNGDKLNVQKELKTYTMCSKPIWELP
jgi:hypothetical protein